jgi:hypothetical protein
VGDQTAYPAPVAYNLEFPQGTEKVHLDRRWVVVPQDPAPVEMRPPGAEPAGTLHSQVIEPDTLRIASVDVDVPDAVIDYVDSLLAATGRTATRQPEPDPSAMATWVIQT